MGERGRRSKERWRRSSQRPGLAVPVDGAGQADLGGADQFALEAVHYRGQETPAADAVDIDAGPAAQQVLDPYGLDRPAPAQGFGLAETGVIPGPVAHQPAVGPAGGGTPRVAVTGPGETEQLDRAQIVGAGVEQAAQLGR